MYILYTSAPAAPLRLESPGVAEAWVGRYMGGRAHHTAQYDINSQLSTQKSPDRVLWSAMESCRKAAGHQSEVQTTAKSAPKPMDVDLDQASEIKDAESKSKIWKCPLCPKYYTRFSSVKRHAEKSHDKPNLQNTTSIENDSGPIAGRLSSINRHIRDNHGTPKKPSKPWKCPQCSNRYTRPSSVNRHIKQDHNTPVHEKNLQTHETVNLVPPEAEQNQEDHLQTDESVNLPEIEQNQQEQNQEDHLQTNQSAILPEVEQNQQEHSQEDHLQTDESANLPEAEQDQEDQDQQDHLQTDKSANLPEVEQDQQEHENYLQTDHSANLPEAGQNQQEQNQEDYMQIDEYAELYITTRIHPARPFKADESRHSVAQSVK
ncbi:hypothetical protein K474DRAFT_1678746 [Panus rudis PR-1116 ss-1]|nr:hypothetical protein K474DRAFT_1678746 [Panus rudis PR-1116 ss-1]